MFQFIYLFSGIFQNNFDTWELGWNDSIFNKHIENSTVRTLKDGKRETTRLRMDHVLPLCCESGRLLRTLIDDIACIERERERILKSR
jgi:hypothetical protein